MNPYKLVGAYASPYSRKMRAVLRYRRLPFRWISRGGRDDVDIPAVPVALIPVLVTPGPGSAAADVSTDVAIDVAMIDSTFQIRHLETRHAERSVVPPDPAIAFLDALVEDFADEWLTKAMFHYRWAFAPDARKASHVLPCDQMLDLPPDQLARGAAAFAERQIGRLAVVGSNPTTAPLIEASYRRLLGILDATIQRRPFCFGRRPSAGDFALFGQLSQLAAFDPTSAALAAEHAPRVVAWVNVMDDLGAVEVGPDDWSPRGQIAEDLAPLFAEIGRGYAPFLLANAAALATGAREVTCEIDGTRWVQSPFPYQAKCLRWLREHFARLAPADQAFVAATLADTGCAPLLHA
jgi:glutathione S-transferase